MKTLSFRELRNTPGAFWKKLRRERAVAVSANGVTRAIVIDVADDDLAEAFTIAERVQAQLAVSRLRARARDTGASSLRPEAIDAEIAAARRRRP